MTLMSIDGRVVAGYLIFIQCEWRVFTLVRTVTPRGILLFLTPTPASITSTSLSHSSLRLRLRITVSLASISQAHSSTSVEPPAGEPLQSATCGFVGFGGGRKQVREPCSHSIGWDWCYASTIKRVQKFHQRLRGIVLKLVCFQVTAKNSCSTP